MSNDKNLESLEELQAKLMEQLGKDPFESHLSNEQLLIEVDNLIRNKPPIQSLTASEDEDGNEWLGRVQAVLNEWDRLKALKIDSYLLDLRPAVRVGDETYYRGYNGILQLLAQARYNLILKTAAPTSTAFDANDYFGYFEEIRKIIEQASTELYFIDPYLDAEFVSRYMGLVPDGVKVRLLAREKLNTLLPSVEAFTKQHTTTDIRIRSFSPFHDRYVFVDGSSCYYSGASFKQGADKKPTSVTQIIDNNAFSAMKQVYEDMWNKANSEN